MRMISVVALMMLLSGCASSVVFPNGKEIIFKGGSLLRDYNVSYSIDGDEEKYKAEANSNVRIPDLNVLSLPGS